MLKLNNLKSYRGFVNERDKALEHILINAQLRIAESSTEAFIDILNLVKINYDMIAVADSHTFNKNRLDQFEQSLKATLTKLGFEIFKHIVDLRKKSYLLTYASEAQAVRQSVGVKFKAMLKKAELENKSEDTQILKKLSYELSQLRRKIIGALEFAVVSGDDTKTAMARVYKALPRQSVAGKRQALRKVKAREAIGYVFDIEKKGRNFSWEIDPYVWQLALDDYSELYIPTDRSPAALFDLSDPNTGVKLLDEVDPENRVWAWQIEKDVTNDFVKQVRDGQIQAAKDNGIDDFVVISVIDERTCESCCGEFGCADFNGKLVSEVEKMTDGEFGAPSYHFNCRCTVAPASKELQTDEAESEKEFEEWLNS